MKIIFWNIKKKDLVNEIDDLVKAEFPDILILCECTIPTADLLLKLNTPKTLYYFIGTKGKSIRIFTSFSDNCVEIKEDSARYSILEISLPLKTKFLLTPLYIPDRRNWSAQSQNIECISISSRIIDIEKNEGINDSIAVGDFNMNPFDEGMISTLGFHAVRDEVIALKKGRVVQGKYYKFFFNPMWNFYSSNKKPKGTYYYWNSEHVCHFWNIFDQFLLRPELIGKLNSGDFGIITKFKQHDLTTSDGLISEGYSDHLPIKATFNI